MAVPGPSFLSAARQRDRATKVPDPKQAKTSRPSALRGLDRLDGFELGRIHEQVGDLCSPIKQPSGRDHHQDAGAANNELLPDAPGVLHEYPMGSKGQEHAQAENRKRMLTAQDQWPQPPRGEPGPTARKISSDQNCQRKEVS